MKCLWHWESDCRSNFFSRTAHLCAVTYIIEISLIVMLTQKIFYYFPISFANSSRATGMVLFHRKAKFWHFNRYKIYSICFECIWAEVSNALLWSRVYLSVALRLPSVCHKLVMFSPSPLKMQNGIQQNLTGSRISTSSTKFVFFGLIRKTRGATVTGCAPVVSFSWKGLY